MSPRFYIKLINLVPDFDTNMNIPIFVFVTRQRDKKTTILPVGPIITVALSGKGL